MCVKFSENNPIRLVGPGFVVQIDESVFSKKPNIIDACPNQKFGCLVCWIPQRRLHMDTCILFGSEMLRHRCLLMRQQLDLVLISTQTSGAHSKIFSATWDLFIIQSKTLYTLLILKQAHTRKPYSRDGVNEIFSKDYEKIC